MLYGQSQINGRGRQPPSTEDRILIRNLSPTLDMFAVFDGHSGTNVVRLTLDLLPRRIAEALTTNPSAAAGEPSALIALLRQAFLDHDKDLARQLQRRADSGSTASVAIVTPRHIVMAYLGDSPAFLMNPTTGLILNEIGKHEPSLASETARIKAAGGTVEIDEMGTPRVDGSLMVSRAFGDFSLKWDDYDAGAPPPFESDWKAMKVTAYPDVAVWTRPELGVLAIMSDGLVETPTGIHKPTAQVARDIQRSLQSRGYNLQDTSKAVVDAHVAADVGSATHRYDGDDLSLLLVDVGRREANAANIQEGGAKAAAAATAAAAARPKTRKARQRRNRTGKKGRLVKIFCC